MFGAQGNDAGLGLAARLAGSIAVELGEFASAFEHLDHALAAYGRAGSRRGEALTVRSVGLVHRAMGEYELSAAALDQLQEVGDELMVAYAVQALVKAQSRLGGGSQERLAEAEQVCHRQRDRFGAALVRRTLGELHLTQGRTAEARECLDEALVRLCGSSRSSAPASVQSPINRPIEHLKRSSSAVRQPYGHEPSSLRRGPADHRVHARVPRRYGTGGSGTLTHPNRHQPTTGHSFGITAVTPGPAITRAEVIQRAKTWLNPPVPYSQQASKGGYRTDCSGYVSMAWKLAAQGWTGDLHQVGVALGSYNELKPGDMLLYHNPSNPQNGSHVVLFGSWVGAVGGDFYLYEQTPPQTVYRKWSQVGYSRSLYKPYRYRNIIEDGQPTPPRKQESAPIRADFNNDGKEDVATFNDMGKGALRLFVRYGGQAGLQQVWEGPNWQIPLGNMKVVAGRFGWSGGADIAAFVDHGNGNLAVWVWKGSQLNNPTRALDLGNWGRSLSDSRLVTADVTGSALTDITVFTQMANGGLRQHVITGGAWNLGLTQTWDAPKWGITIDSMRFTAGHFGWTDRDDIAAFVDYGKGRLGVWVWKGNQLNNPAQAIDLPGWGVPLSNSKVAVSDLNGDGLADLPVFTGIGQGALREHVITGGAWNLGLQQTWDAPSWGYPITSADIV